MAESRTTLYEFNVISNRFRELDGYYNLSNADLGRLLESLKLLEDANKSQEAIIRGYQKWSFTVSFLQLINAWQWFFSGILLGRQAYLPAQVMQMYYYSIFFSYGSFLSAQFKGHYTLSTQNEKDGKIKKDRKEVWIGDGVDIFSLIHTKNKGKGGEHEIRAKWFHTVFKDWTFAGSYPDVSAFDADKVFHSHFRNMYTYSLSDIAEELYGVPNSRLAPSNKDLIRLWNRDAYVAECFLEEFSALEHVKVATDLHSRLLEKYEKGSPYSKQQIILLRNLCAHHDVTGLKGILQEAMPNILKTIEK